MTHRVDEALRHGGTRDAALQGSSREATTKEDYRRVRQMDHHHLGVSDRTISSDARSLAKRNGCRLCRRRRDHRGTARGLARQIRWRDRHGGRPWQRRRPLLSCFCWDRRGGKTFWRAARRSFDVVGLVLRCLPQLPSAGEQFGVIIVRWSELKVPLHATLQIDWRNFAEQVRSDEIPHGRRRSATSHHRFISVELESHIVFAVEKKLDLARRPTDFAIVHIDQRLRWSRGDRDRSAYAADCGSGDQGKQGNQQQSASTHTAGSLASLYTTIVALLETHGLVKSYNGRRVVDSVSFTVDAGEIVGLLGRNGAGKTTSFRMAIGMITPEAGRVTFDNQDVTDQPMYQHARAGMGYLSQEPSVFQRLSVEDNLMAILQTRPMRRSEQRTTCNELLAQFGLQHKRFEEARTCSGGERRRLEIARSLITKPRLILLDEPFAAVDPHTVEELQAEVRRLADRGIAILLTDHNVQQTLRICTRAYIIHEGKNLREGDPKSIINDPMVREAYLAGTFRGDEFD